MLQCVAVDSEEDRREVVQVDILSLMQCAAVCCSVLQYVAVCCSVLQCVAVYCSVLRVLQSVVMRREERWHR